VIRDIRIPIRIDIEVTIRIKPRISNLTVYTMYLLYAIVYHCSFSNVPELLLYFIWEQPFDK